MVVSLFKHQDVEQADIFPDVSLIIAVHNEEKVIREKLENSLSQDYPEDKLEIIVASDCSDDKTDEIVSEFEKRGVKLISIPERRGKESAQREAIKEAKGEILVLTDASIMLNKDALRNIVRNFNDRTVGCVSSVDKILNSESEGEGFYVRYEMFLRKLESKIYSLVGLSGSFFVIRKGLCQEWPSELPSDFLAVLSTVKKGYRSIIDHQAIGYYRVLSSSTAEFQRKVRTVARGLRVLVAKRELLNPLRYGFFSIQLLSHKLMRWVVPFLYIIFFLSSMCLTFCEKNSIFYVLIFLIQLLFFALTIFGYIREKEGKQLSAIYKIPLFFFISNLAILSAWIKLLCGKKFAAWEPSSRT